MIPQKNYFNLRKAKFRPNVKVMKVARNKFVRALLYLFYPLGLMAIIYLALHFILVFKAIDLSFLPFLNKIIFSNQLAGAASLVLALTLIIFSTHLFYKGSAEEPSPKTPPEIVLKLSARGEVFNLADFLSTAALLTVDNALKRSQTKDKNLIDVKELYRELANEKRGKFVITRLGFNSDDFLKTMEKFYSGKDVPFRSLLKLDEIFEDALKVAALERHPKIYVSDVIAALSINDSFLKQLIFDLEIKFEDVLNIVYWQTTDEIYNKEKKFNPDRLKLSGGVGRDWAMGYALALSRYGKELTRMAARLQAPVHLIGRLRETEEMEKILIRATHHNVILIGPPGVGKSTIVMNFARRVSSGETYNVLANRRIFELNVDYLLAGATSSGEIIERLNAVLNDAVRTGNIILFIENIQALFGAGEKRVGSVDASDVMIPYLENSELFFIATTNLGDFHQYIETKNVIADKFEKIEVAEPDKDKTLRVLEDILHWLEPAYGVTVTYGALQKIVDLSDRYLYEKSFPEKALDLLNEAVVLVKTQGRNVIYPVDAEKVIQSKTKVPIGEGEKAEKERLLHLEDFLHQRVIGQDLAITAVANAMRRARAGIGSSHKPIGSFLFLGPTGVGKTETAKALAESYFSSEEKMIRFDMSEYQDISGLHRLLGAPPGTPQAEAGGQLTNAVKDNPFSLLLFDEIEKADPDILNIFLQILDEGWVTDSLGRKVKLNNTIIIATSNAGAEYIREKIKTGIKPKELSEGLLNYLQEKRLFRPEFLNRFNAVISFNPLDQDQVVEITSLMIRKLTQKLAEEKGVFINVTPEAIKKLAELGYDPLLGARPIARVIEQKVENFLAKKMLGEEIKRGSGLVFDVTDIGE